jgi:hypothetical protein
LGRFDSWLLAGDDKFDRRIGPFTRKEPHSLAECDQVALRLFVLTLAGIVSQVVDWNFVERLSLRTRVELWSVLRL